MLKRSTKIMWLGIPLTWLIFMPEAKVQLGEVVFYSIIMLGIVIFVGGIVVMFVDREFSGG